MTKRIKMPAFHNEPKHAWARAALAAALMVAAGAASAQGGQVVQGAPDPGIRLGKSGTAAPTHVCIDSTSSPAWTLMYATADAGCSKKEMERVTVKDFQSSAVRSRLRARVGLDWDTPVQGLTLGGRVHYTGKQWADSGNRMRVPAWKRLDLMASYSTKIACLPVRLNASVENVADKKYWIGTFGDGFVMPGAPRTFKVSATVSF